MEPPDNVHLDISDLFPPAMSLEKPTQQHLYKKLEKMSENDEEI